MTTANATTNEGGYKLVGAAAVGKPLTPNQMYSERTPANTIWNYRYSDLLTTLRYSKNSPVSIGASHLLDKLNYSIVNNCHVYTSNTPRHWAIHCPDIGKVIILMQQNEFVVDDDSSFTGRIPR
jgi:hypothetical protein